MISERMTSGRMTSGRMIRGATALALALALLTFFVALAHAAPTYPALTGRIVDLANIIPQSTRDALEPKLRELEDKSGIQLVVATVPSLQGYEIEPYANDLFRLWKLGEAKANNGVLLLVAPNERRVRIEVGYGLEGTLTDALSKVIIANAITPRFKAGDFAGGVQRGVEDIITVLTTDASEWEKRPSLRVDAAPADEPLGWLPIALIIAFLTALVISPGFRWLVLNLLLNMAASSGSGGGRSSGGFSGGGGFSSGGGGFSGGGGSSGGGGASGSW